MLADRAEALGPLAHYLLEVEWPELYRRAEQAAAWRALAQYLDLARHAPSGSSSPPRRRRSCW